MGVDNVMVMMQAVVSFQIFHNILFNLVLLLNHLFSFILLFCD